ncbi:PIR Superfamily Protein [Plasmodium ovale wallikeri]|uniref:PIR Superfamily Protein n=1 Tax=Plasmodium ovale wallikeri TaxID=864142 RepID=A0A1A8YI48_PLAOA|nr:PIR Superfamily Protein [Plasmodium ovale wallikeri]
MASSLDDLAKNEIYKGNQNFVKLFNVLDNACTNEDKGYTCESFEYTNIDQSFKSEVEKIFNILKRTKTKEDIYIKEKSLGNFNPCVYYKYWFYHKLISNNSEKIDINSLYETWNNNLSNIYGIFGERCKFHAKSLKDVNILKILYDHILFFYNTEQKNNIINEIKKCEFCNHLKNYIDSTFRKEEISCSDLSPYALCMEHKDHLKEIINLDQLFSLSCEKNTDIAHYHSSIVSHEQAKEATPGIHESGSEILSPLVDTSKHSYSQNTKGTNLADKNVIGGISVLGISFILFFLYKFTSFRSLIHRRTGWIRKMWKNPQENTDDFLLHDSETENTNSDNTQYNLTYTSVHNY